MQSSRRKRERSENDQDAEDGAKQAQKTKTSHIGDGDGAQKHAANEVSPEDEPKTSTGQVQPLQGASNTTERTNGGNIDSQETTTTGPTAVDTSNEAMNETTLRGDVWEGTGMDTRQKRIAALISHRNILLERMTQCKTAAGSRLKRNYDKIKQTLDQKESKGGSQDAEKKGEGEISSDNEEIERYKETCQRAVEVNRKQRAQASEMAVEKRSSVSLRRGSGVGKRMNDALSSLAPGSGATSSLPLNDSNASMPATSGSETFPPAPAMSLQMPMENSKQAALYASQQRVQPVKSGGMYLPTNLKHGSGQHGARKRSGSTGQRTAKTYQGSSSLSHGTSLLPLHVGTGGSGTSGLPINRLAHPMVDFPEARNLREKRDIIRTKLNALIHERLERIQQTNTADKADADGAAQLRSFAALTEKPSLEECRLALPRMVLERGVNSPSKLPRRRKTHWDYLLEEMRWLATDFVEERKWKMASGRTLASSMVTNRLNAAALVEKKAHNDDGKGEGENPVEEMKVCATEDTGAGSNMISDPSEEAGARKYTHPIPSDTSSVRLTAHIISDMMAEVWMGAMDCGLSASSDEPLMAALARHHKHRMAVKKIEEAGGLQSMSSKQPAPLQTGFEEDKENGSGKTNTGDEEKSISVLETENETVESIRFTNLSNEDISERITLATDSVKNRTIRRNRGKPTKDPVALGSEQRKAADFVEFVWGGDDSAAPCLSGPIGTGKTVLSCSLLWKRRSQGPQLVVCPPTRLIRWAYELERFVDLNVLVFGMRCGLSSAVPDAKAHSKFQASDVVICEFSSLVQLEQEAQDVALHLSRFCTAILDARFPAECLVDLPRPNKSSPPAQGKKATRKPMIPPELISHQWWASLLKSLGSSQAQRLLIDNSECRFLSENECLDKSGLTERQRLDTVAAMVSFVVGPDIFSCDKSRSIQHKAVSWAKYTAREGNARKRPLFGEVRGVLVDAAFPFRYTIATEACGSGGKEDIWEARLCALSISQRSAYEECCVGVRGALAFGDITDYAYGQNRPEPYQHAVQGLMKLRRVCVHSQIEDVLGKLSLCPSDLRGQGFANVANRLRMVAMISTSVSQPHADVARDILSGSAKLRELVSILREECGFGVVEGFVITETELAPEHKSRKTASKKPTKKKVAILAVLPEVQLLTSILLNAIGIQHELLGSSSFLKGGESIPSNSGTRLEKELYSSRAWIDSQLALLRFSSTLPHTSESDDGGSSDHSVSIRRASCQIVVASPVLVGADNGSLGIEAADLVICLDEDWSGRDTALLHRISKRCTFANEMREPDNGAGTESDCSFVRLVCEDTCEHVFLSDFNVSMDQHWLTDSRGLAILAKESEAFPAPVVEKDFQPGRDNVGGHFRFPASSILRFRGKVLSNVLMPKKHIPPAFASGNPVRFLPYNEDISPGSKRISFELVRSLIAEEDRSMQTYRVHGYLLGDGRTSVVLKDSNNANTIPPSLADFPRSLMTRHDMMVIASRLYLDRFGKHLFAIGGAGTHEHSTERRLAGSSARDVLTAGTNAFVAGGHGQLTDVWHRGGLSCKPVDLVPALLSYSAGVGLQSVNDSTKADEVMKQKPKKSQGAGAVIEGETTSQNMDATDEGVVLNNEVIISTTPRTNLFTACYCSSREVVSNVVKDGNQGFEPLPYFPPLVPSLLAASEHAQTAVASRSSLHGGLTGSAMAPHNLPPNGMLDSAPPKRTYPTVVHPIGVASKRPRIEKVPSVVKARHAFEAAPSARAAAFFSLAPPGTGKKDYGSLWMDASIVTEDEGSQWEQSPFLFDMGEDFGLLGVGALLPEHDSSQHASMVSVDAITYSKWKDPYEAGGLDSEIYSSTIPCDAEEVEAYIRGETDDSFLDTMLLFVASQAPSTFAGISAPASSSQLGGLSFPGTASAWTQTATGSVVPPPAAAAALVGPDGNAVNGTGSGKKAKRKLSQSGMSVGAFALVNPTDMTGRSMNAYAGTSPQHSSKNRESYRSKRLASILARQGGGGRASLFQVPSFLLASIRVRDDVLRRVLGHSQRSSPYPDRRYWTRACFKLSSSNKQTGDSAIQMSKIQTITMSTAPAPVDFGPFVAGYISSRYAACGAVPSSAEAGISLPMGVKVPRRSGEKQVKGWLAIEDKKLKESVLRYGLNWHLVAKAVNNFDDDSKQHDPERDQPLFHPQPRSPRQCHERWNHLVKIDPELLQGLRYAERSRHDKTMTEPSSYEMGGVPCHRITKKSLPGSLSASNTGAASLSLVLSSSLFVDKDGDAVMADQKERSDFATKGRGKKSFSALRDAAKKEIVVSLPIPGSADGVKPNLVGAHPSHAQTVQAAAVGTSGGKSEMWPLQILDMADKQRAARNPSGSSSAGNSRQPSGPSAAQVRSPGHQPSPNRPPPPFQVPHAMASPSRSPQTNPHHPQGYPTMSVNGSGPVPGGAPFRGPPPVGNPRASK